VALVGYRVSHLWFGFGKFPLKMSNFSIQIKSKYLWVGSKAGWPLTYCGSKVSLGQGPSLGKCVMVLDSFKKERVRVVDWFDSHLSCFTEQEKL